MSNVHNQECCSLYFRLYFKCSDINELNLVLTLAREVGAMIATVWGLRKLRQRQGGLAKVTKPSKWRLASGPTTLLSWSTAVTWWQTLWFMWAGSACLYGASSILSTNCWKEKTMHGRKRKHSKKFVNPLLDRAQMIKTFGTLTLSCIQITWGIY